MVRNIKGCGRMVSNMEKESFYLIIIVIGGRESGMKEEGFLGWMSRLI